MSAAETTLTPTLYMGHHLGFNELKLGGGGFWTLHVDTVVMSLLLGIIGFGFLRWVAAGASSGVPSKRQAFVELCFDFVDTQVKSIFHGARHVLVAPLALTVFVWSLLMNAMDWLPLDISSKLLGAVGIHHWRLVPTADVNTTFALALTIWLLMLFFNVKVKGLGGWLHELFCTPFGSNPLLWPANLILNAIEYISKPLSHSLRLFGNLYAGEIIFLLLGMWAASGAVGVFFSALLGLGWAIFHLLIVPLQAFIFMMLTVAYLAMAHESH